MVKEYAGALVECDQDYFHLRSTLIADAIIELAADADLRRVFIQFFDSVSPFRICRYDVLRRKAYDNEIALRVFANADEGREFYERLYARDRSPYNLQHAALYLSRRGQFGEAFEFIDRARNQAGLRNWTINNSYAIILFYANIQHFEDPQAKETLADSMRILGECYRWDRRKAYHATKYGENAAKLWELAPDEEAKKCILTAHKWLCEEKGKSPWNRGIEYTLRKVERLVRRVGA
jgi:hypothetical protein